MATTPANKPDDSKTTTPKDPGETPTVIERTEHDNLEFDEDTGSTTFIDVPWPGY